MRIRIVTRLLSISSVGSGLDPHLLAIGTAANGVLLRARANILSGERRDNLSPILFLLDIDRPYTHAVPAGNVAALRLATWRIATWVPEDEQLRTNHSVGSKQSQKRKRGDGRPRSLHQASLERLRSSRSQVR